MDDEVYFRHRQSINHPLNLLRVDTGKPQQRTQTIPPLEVNCGIGLCWNGTKARRRGQKRNAFFRKGSRDTHARCSGREGKGTESFVVFHRSKEANANVCSLIKVGFFRILEGEGWGKGVEGSANCKF